MSRRKIFLTGNPTEDFKTEVSALTKDLYYISETDSEIFPYTGAAADVVTGEVLLEQIGKPAETPFEERDFAEFFERLTAMQNWFGKDEKKIAKRFEKLKNFLQQNLNNLKIFKIGSVQIDLYIVGLNSESKISGVQTKAVET